MPTNNRTPTIRHKDDYYITPEWCTELLLEQLKDNGYNSILNKNSIMFDPCAGNGAIIKSFKKAFPNFTTWANDINYCNGVEQSGADKVYNLDFLTMEYLANGGVNPRPLGLGI